jgi:hypothetical protein
MAWNTSNGFYISPIILDAPWDDEVAKLQPAIGEHINKHCLEKRNFDEKIIWLSFKSKDGDPYTKPAIPNKGEIPEDYKWTSAYYDNPVLKKLIDWFPVEKTRVRLSQEQPGAVLQPHFDWDNTRFADEVKDRVVRIWVQLDDSECWYRLTNGDVDASFTLKRGQFIVLNVDTVIHATYNRSDKPRNNLIIHAHTNFWIKNLPDLFPNYAKLDPTIDDPQ